MVKSCLYRGFPWVKINCTTAAVKSKLKRSVNCKNARIELKTRSREEVYPGEDKQLKKYCFILTKYHFQCTVFSVYKQCLLSSATINCLEIKDIFQILRKSDVAVKEAAALMFAIKCDECRGRVNQTLSAVLPTVISGLDMPP